MVFESWEVLVRNYSSTVNEVPQVSIPFAFRSLLNKIKLEYINVSYIFADSTTTRSNNGVMAEITELPQLTNNINIGTPVVTGVTGAPITTQVMKRTFSLISNSGGASYNGNPIELTSDFNLKIWLANGAAVAVGDRGYLLITIGYNV